MKHIIKSFLSLILLSFLYLPANAQKDWAQFDKYKNDNEIIKALAEEKRPVAVFMGNSITEGWVLEDPDFFKNNNYIGRGISGQTSYQMLSRFREDVVNLQPQIVVINAGSNDIAENSHPYNEDVTFGNILSMVEIAQANGINVILSSVLPADKFYWNTKLNNVPQKIDSLNHRIKSYALAHNIPYADYNSAMKAEDLSMIKEYSKDGVHPNKAGYTVMETIVSPLLSVVVRE